VIDDRVIAELEKNLAATIRAFGLGGLPRKEAFAFFDEPNNRHVGDVVDRAFLPAPIEQWAQLVPRCLIWPWCGDDVLSYEMVECSEFPFRVFRLLGYESSFIWLEIDGSIRRSGLSLPDDWESLAVVDIVPSLQFRAFCVSHCEAVNFPQEPIYLFRPGELLGVDMTGEQFLGYSRFDVAESPNLYPVALKNNELMRRFYKQIGVPLDYRDINPGV
jgi:hypothetical protein